MSAVVSCVGMNQATAGDFKLTVTTATSCSKDDTVAVTVKAKPTVDVADSVVRSGAGQRPGLPCSAWYAHISMHANTRKHPQHATELT